MARKRNYQQNGKSLKTTRRRTPGSTIKRHIEFKFKNYTKMLDKHAWLTRSQTWRDDPGNMAMWTYYYEAIFERNSITVNLVDFKKWAFKLCREYVDKRLANEAKLEARRNEYRRKYGYSPPW